MQVRVTWSSWSQGNIRTYHRWLLTIHLIIGDHTWSLLLPILGIGQTIFVLLCYKAYHFDNRLRTRSLVIICPVDNRIVIDISTYCYSWFYSNTTIIIHYQVAIWCWLTLCPLDKHIWSIQACFATYTVVVQNTWGKELALSTYFPYSIIHRFYIMNCSWGYDNLHLSGITNHWICLVTNLIGYRISTWGWVIRYNQLARGRINHSCSKSSIIFNCNMDIILSRLPSIELIIT